MEAHGYRYRGDQFEDGRLTSSWGVLTVGIGGGMGCDWDSFKDERQT